MAIVNDLIEVTSISAGTTYSSSDGTILGVVDGADKSPNPADPDNEFNEGDTLTIDGVVYTITVIQEPSSTGSILLGDGTTETFTSRSESNLDVMFLTVTDGTTTRYFILPNDSYGDMNIQSITTGGINDVAGSDALIAMANDDDINIVCFAEGTLISVGDDHSVPVEQLHQGDLVQTADNGQKPISWIGKQHVTLAALSQKLHLRPIRIRAGALGPGLPAKDLLVSQQHRVLVRSEIARKMFDQSEVLVAAKQLVEIDGVDVAEDLREVTYYHFLFDQHEIVFANDARTESFYPGPEALRSLSAEARREIFQIFPVLADINYRALSVRPIAPGRKARRMAMRHKHNAKPLVAASR